MRARKHRRIHQRSQRHGLEIDLAIALVLYRQRSAIAPSRGQLERRGDGNIVRMSARLIEHNLVPTQHVELRRSGSAGRKTLRRSRHDQIKGRFNGINASRQREMEGVHVVESATPSQPLTIGRELQPGEINHRPSRTMLAGDPLGINQRNLRPASDRNLKLGMKNLFRRVGRVH